MVQLVAVGCSFHSDGTWSARVRAAEEVLAEVTASSGCSLVGAVAARLAELADRWQRPIQAVYDLGGDPLAFAVVAHVEGFSDAICFRLDRPQSA